MKLDATQAEFSFDPTGALELSELVHEQMKRKLKRELHQERDYAQEQEQLTQDKS